MFRTLAASAVASMFATAANATNVSVIQGEALLRRGDGYESVKGVAELSPGDTVVAKAGSSVKVTFSNGCTVFLGMGMVFSVPAEPPCGGVDSSGTTTGAIPDATASAQDWSAVTQTTVTPPETQTNITPYLLGAVTIGGISAAALAFSGGGGGTPTSP